MAIERVSVYKLDTSPASDSLKDLRAQLKEAKNAMLSAEQGSDAYTAALQRAANIQHTLKEQMEEVNASAMDFGQIASNVTKTVGGMVAGIQAGNAVMNLMGYESEDVAKSLQKMQNLMAITQAIPSIVEGGKAFGRLATSISTATGATSKFSKALISTGLGAIAVALGYIVTHFEDISKWLDDVTGKTNLVATIIDNVLAAWDTAGVAVIESLKLVGTAIENHVLAPFRTIKKGAETFFGSKGNFIDRIKGTAKAMKDEFVGAYQEIGDQAKGMATKVSTNFSANLSATVDARTKAEKEKAEKERKEAEEKARKEREAAEKARKAEEERQKKEREKYLQDVRNKFIELSDYLDKAGMDKYEKQIDDITKTFYANIDTLAEALENGVITEEEYLKRYNQILTDTQKKTSDVFKEEIDDMADAYNAFLDNANSSFHGFNMRQHKSMLDAGAMTKREYLDMTEGAKGYLHEMNTALGYSTYALAEFGNSYEAEKHKLQELLKEGVITQEDYNERMSQLNQKRRELLDRVTQDQHNAMLANMQVIREEMDTLRDYADETANAMDLILGTGQGLSSHWTDAFNTMSSSLINLGENLRNGTADWTDYAKVAAAGLYSIGSIMSALAEEQNADTEEGFEQQKKYQIAAATMNMLGGITAAWVSALNPANAWMTIWGQIGMGAATTAMLLATGIMQIQKIKEQQFNGGGGGSSSGAQGASISPGAMAAITAPVQYTQDVQGSDIEGALADQRVYVLESDISGTQRRVNVAEGEARY